MRNLRSFLVVGLSAATVAACGGDDEQAAAPPVVTTVTTGGMGGSGGMATTTTSTTSAGPGGNGGTGGAPVDDPPGPVIDLAAQPDPVTNGIDVSWTNPSDADLAGILIVRGAGVPVDFVPSDGTTYTAGDAAGTDQEVLFASAGQATTLDGPVPGLAYSFAAWAYDQAGQYSTVELTGAVQNLLGAQKAMIEVALDGTVTVNQQPPNFTLSGTATVAVPNITLNLTIQNDTARTVYNLKGLYDTFNEGNVDSLPLWPLVNGMPSSYYGLDPLAVGSMATRTVTIAGVTGNTDPVTFEVDLVDAPMMYAKQSWDDFCEYDVSNSNNNASTDFNPSRPHWGALLADGGTTLYFGAKNSSEISTYDLLTNTQGATAALGTQPAGSVADLAKDRMGNIYALVNDGVHIWAGNGNSAGSKALEFDNQVSLVKLDAALNETARLTLTMAADQAVGRNLDIHGGSGRLALSIWEADGTDKIWFVDLPTFTLVDTDPNTAGDQGIDVSGTATWEMAYSRNGALFVAYANGTTHVDRIDPMTHAVTAVTYTGGGRVFDVEPIANNLYLAMRDGVQGGLIKIDSMGNQTSIDPGFDSVGQIGVVRGGNLLLTASQRTSVGSGVAILDPMTDTVIDTDGDPNNATLNGDGCGTHAAHWMFATP